MTMRLSDHLRDGLVVAGVKASGTREALETFGALLEGNGIVASGREATEALLAREEVHTTVLGDGVAVPHATLPGLSDVVLMVAAADAPVPFGPPETDPVDLFFLLLSPPGSEGTHIKLLARICRLARHQGVMEDLRSADTDGALKQAILKVDSEHV